jgi:hydroxymethylglutaryl-CoA lyase
VAELTAKLLEMGCGEVSLGDTIGAGNRHSVAAMLDAVLERAPAARLAGHYHDTSRTALEMIAVSLEKGLRVFDASVGGLGGCPYAPGATGNANSREVLELLNASGFDTGIDLDAFAAAEAIARQVPR